MINLLPSDLKQSRLYGRRNRTIVGYCFGVIVIGVLIVSITFYNMSYVTADDTRLRNEMLQREVEAAKLEAGQKDVDKIANQIKTIDKLYSGEIKFSELIPKIGNLLPNGAVLNGLTLTGGKTSPLQLDIDIETQDLAATFQQNLVNSDIFEAADISAIVGKGGSTTPKPGVKEYPFGASLIASFKGSAAAKKQATTPAATTPAKTTGGAQ